jgi:hypothetical protein
VSVWAIVGIPLAVGGPSKNTKAGQSFRLDILFWNILFSLQKSRTCFSLFTKANSVETGLNIDSPPKKKAHYRVISDEWASKFLYIFNC